MATLLHNLFNLLRPQSECCAGNARRQMESLDDLLPQLLVDHIDETTARYHQVVELIQV